ncbi:MAG TPA: sigma-70 family RNA polymerase sigma factor [Gemmataceae bacterium]|jgi:RNA polymerase sigma-70 factor (ECF subfamily)|nr:sigma-70 family RNA polymerase sigma factor [Gemmataceae bacterium]
MPDLKALQQRVQQGEREALAEFLEGYRPQLLGFIERRLGDTLRSKVEPQDIFQEMALAAWNVLPKTDLSDREPFGWLCQIAEQRIIDVARKFHSQKRAAEREVAANAVASDSEQEWINLLAASMTTPTQAATRAERYSVLAEAIKSLPAETQNVLRWRYVENMPTKDIAKKLRKTDGAIRVLLTRTLHRLQDLMREQGITSVPQ